MRDRVAFSCLMGGAVLSKNRPAILVQLHPGASSSMQVKREDSLHRASAGRAGTFAVLSGVSLLAFGLISLCVKRSGTTKLDAKVSESIVRRRNSGLTMASTTLTIIGSAPVVAAILSALYLNTKKDKRPLILYLVLQTIGLGFMNSSVKLLLRRDRPPYKLYSLIESSYPSSHASAGVAFFGLLAIIAAKEGESRAVVPLALFIPAVGFSRIYLGVHWISDVLAGYFIGAAYLFGSLAVLEKKGWYGGESRK